MISMEAKAGAPFRGESILQLTKIVFRPDSQKQHSIWKLATRAVATDHIKGRRPSIFVKGSGWPAIASHRMHPPSNDGVK